MAELGIVTLLVRDYSEAIRYYVGRAGFHLVEDRDLGGGRRWVRIRPSGERGACLLLARADSPDQEAAIGRQAGGRVGFFLYTDDFDADHERMVAAGVRFEEEPREESYGRVAVWNDLYGNRWDLIQLRHEVSVR